MATIEPNFESICINPNDDLVLYKKEIVRSRIEKFLYAICSLDTDDLPTPLSRIEELYNCLVTGEDIPTFTPLSRAEKFVMAMLGAYDVELLPTPISRSETLMKKIATGDNNLDDVDNLQSRYEFLLAYIIKAGGFNGGSGDFYYNLTSLTSGFTTIYNTLDMPVKNAVLRGKTLVNLAVDGLTEKILSPNRYADFDSNLYKQSTTYTIILNVVTLSDTGTIAFHEYDEGTSLTTNIAKINIGINKILFTSSNNVFNKIRLRNPNGATTNLTIKNVMILEGDHTNADIPYFEGITSVKMPVLTTTGKNLYNKTPFIGYIDSSNGKFVKNNTSTRKISDYIEVKPNTTYKVSGCTMTAMWGYDNDKNPVSAINIYTDYITTTNDMCFIAFNIDSELEHSNIQIEEGTVATPYEPFKSNILTCNEEVTLRGIGDIKDELNLLTGELTQRVGEIVLNGDENWNSYGNQSNQVNTVAFKLSHTNHVSSWGTGFGCCDKLPFTNGDVVYGQDLEGVTTDANNIVVRVNKSKASSIDEFKAWLSNYNIMVVYPLKEEVIKTVDLSTLDQDGKETKLKTFDDITHVTVSSEGLVPTGDIDIARPIQFVDYSLDNSLTTLYNTLEYPVKSAILKGQTLVNLVDFETNTVRSAGTIVTKHGNKITFTTSTAGKFNLGCTLPMLKPNTKYLLKIKAESSLSANVDFNILDVTSNVYIISNTTISDTTHFFTTNNNVNNIKLAFYRGTSVGDDTVSGEAVICEYQDGMENWDISYFEGMASVKMPVLMTTGKNLIDINTLPIKEKNNCEVIDGVVYKKPTNAYEATRWVIPVKPNTTYTISVKGSVGIVQISNFLQSTSPTIDKRIQLDKGNSTVTFTTSSHTELTLSIYNPELANYEVSDIQLEYGIQKTSYEPHKSTTVSCNEEVELRGIGDIKDELNLTTGELTQRIGEFVLDGSSDELWDIITNASGLKRFVSRVKKTHSNYLEITNWLPTANKSYWSINENGFYIGTNGEPVIVFNTNDSRYNMSITEFENYLSQNPLIVRYPLIESVKTVELSTLNQDGEKTKLNTFDDITHVTVSSEGLVPTGVITVATKNATDVVDASIMSLRMDDILNSQETLEGSANTQSDDIDVAMLGTTDIYEQLL